MVEYMSGMKMFDPGLFAIALATLVGQTWAIVHVLDADRPTKEKDLSSCSFFKTQRLSWITR